MKGECIKMDLKIKMRKDNSIKVIILILLLSLVFTGCDNKKKTYKFIEDINYTSAVFEKNNNIYLYDKDYNYLEPIGELSRFKEFSTLNQANKYIAYKYIDENDKINIYDITNRKTEVLKLEEEGEISYLQWFDNLLVVGLYQNPTTNKYLVYNIENFELVNSCKGILIDVLDEGKTMVYGENKQGVTSIHVNDQEIYTLEQEGEVLLGGKISPDKNEISFLTFIFDRETYEQKEYLYIGKLKKNKLSNLKKLEKPYSIDGEVKYDGDNPIIISQDEYVGIEDNEFIIKNLEAVNESINENADRLKRILKDTFKSEITDTNKSWTELGIKNITWFAK